MCLSGAAFGAAIATLFSSRRQTNDRDAITHHMLMQQQQMFQQFQMQALQQQQQQQVEQPTQPSPQERQMKGTQETSEDVQGNLSMEVGAWEGFSMEDARNRSEQYRADFKDSGPTEVLSSLQRGNARFWTGCAVRPEKSAFERRALIMAQFPKAAVLGCSDSRVPVEVIFDQGLGDMFVVRVAGNCLDTSTKASLQYAVHHLKVKVLLVMGHEGCGAVKAAGLPVWQIEKEPAELADALKGMKVGLNEKRLKNVHDSRAYDREAVVTNVRRQVEGLCEDEAIMQKVEAKELILVGCFYEISSGIVDFFMEVTEAPEPKSQPEVVMRGISSGVQSRLEYRKDGKTPTATLQKGKSSRMVPDPDASPVREPDAPPQAPTGLFGLGGS